MIALSPARIRAFQNKILRFYRHHGRQLPWRETTDPYKITVSEIMLQQTQVERVLPKYLAWLKRWPSWEALAKAGMRELLQEWSGLGYNRRALMLGAMARTVVEEHGGVLPDSPEALLRLPGIGPYTAHAILIFAFNRPLVTVDTNIRRVLLHEFGLPATLSQSDTRAVALQVLPKRRSRLWHNALMDYSALVLPRRLAHIPPLTRQSKFTGSRRQIRGEIIRRVTEQERVSLRAIARDMERTLADVLEAAQMLAAENVITLRGSVARLVER